MEKGDIVLLKEDESSRNIWPLAIVDEAYLSQDGKVQKVKVRVADCNLDKCGVRAKSQTVLERPVHKCILLHESTRSRPKDSTAEEPLKCVPL